MWSSLVHQRLSPCGIEASEATFFFLEKKNAPDKLRFQKEIRLEMNTNDAKEYLARREIPQLFEVRAGVR